MMGAFFVISFRIRFPPEADPAEIIHIESVLTAERKTFP